MTRSARIVDVVRPEEPCDFACHVIGLVRHPPRCDEEREAVRSGLPDPRGGEVEGVVPGNPSKAPVPLATDHRKREATELAEFPRAPGAERIHAFKRANVERAHRV